MEIYSLRSASSFFFREDSRNTRAVATPDFEQTTHNETTATFEDSVKRVDFTSLSPREVREFAQGCYDTGKISHDTWGELSSDLPMQTLNANGEVVDTSNVTDDTQFDFVGYFSDRLEIARSIGTVEETDKIENVLSFFASA
ncbi:hypothetical protein [Rhizobium sp. RM]|uniref:hypothetical protein n=1 Tax=Rhizobium sp. RM TaxID=2748079 RepID=UPI00110E7F8B|nr:hypothetical protein [Rhizobium sp. RM]NWJ23301.1 hypothetical protein [Rhizobium sp. RM]TMV14173.1 hypothetical protein BJG94_23315 [Rhizobium sp. Td3]